VHLAAKHTVAYMIWRHVVSLLQLCARRVDIAVHAQRAAMAAHKPANDPPVFAVPQAPVIWQALAERFFLLSAFLKEGTRPPVLVLWLAAKPAAVQATTC
jgi:hypothetical protein